MDVANELIIFNSTTTGLKGAFSTVLRVSAKQIFVYDFYVCIHIQAWAKEFACIAFVGRD